MPERPSGEAEDGAAGSVSDMTGVDWIIVGLLLLLALFGWAQGFVTGALALIGFALGAWLGTRLAGLVLPDGSRNPYAPAIGLVGALIVGAGFAAGFEGLGVRLRSRMTVPGFGFVDGVLGALLTACVGLGVVWILGAVAVHSNGDVRYEVQRSEILSRLNKALPPSGPLLNALARFDPFPRIDGPEANVAPPAKGIGRDPQVRAAAASVVKILGTACGLGVEGSGWVARDGVVVTNAHVVAGQTDTKVLLRGRGSQLDATAIAFDPRNDLAVLRVPGLKARPLPLADAPGPGRSAAILGFPENGPYDVRAGPARGHAHDRDLRRLRARPGAAAADLAARGGPLRQLRRPDGGRQGPRRGDDLRRHHDRSARRLRGAQLGHQEGARGRARAGRHRPLCPLTRALQSSAQWPRRSSSQRSRPWGATSRGCSLARSRSRTATSSPTITSSPGRSATSCSSPSRTSTTPSSRSGRWPICRSCPTASSSSCATSARASRCR